MTESIALCPDCEVDLERITQQIDWVCPACGRKFSKPEFNEILKAQSEERG
jgi:ribosomal protein L37AE/L43A